MKQQVQQLIKKHNLEHEETTILNTLYECVRCIPTHSSSISIGSSKFGGYPHLPARMEVPSYKGQPLTLLAQWNLAHISFVHKDLPQSGMLYFFYYCSPPDVEEYLESPWGEFEEREGWRVLYTEEMNDLHVVEQEGAYAYAESALAFEKAQCVSNDVYFDDEDDYEKYEQVVEDMQDVHSPLHQVFGNPQEVQNSVFEECEYSSKSGIDEKEWELLFQIDSDEEFLDIWGDAGMLYFCIPKKSLQQRLFDDTWMIMQSH
jgi:uncharacterized protein YwqG